MLSFQPEPEVVLKARYKDALVEVWDLEEMKVDPDKRPGNLRKHVFDFYDGLRLIISRDRDGKDIYTHYSASMSSTSEPPDIRQFVGFIMAHINSLRDTPIQGRCNLFGSEGGIIHVTYLEGQENQFEGLRPTGNPKWN